MNRVQNFLSDESGVTAIEYALIASLIAVFIIAAVQLVGTNSRSRVHQGRHHPPISKNVRAPACFGPARTIEV